MSADQPGLDTLRKQFAEHGQEHVFRFWDRLGEAEREAFLEQTARIAPTLASLIPAQRRAIEALRSPRVPDMQPATGICLPEYGGDPEAFEAARQQGLDIQASGRVAILVVAGGQGSRLGFEGPKGSYPVGPVTDRSLFEIQAQKIRGLVRRTGVAFPWYVMTSPSTDAPTRELFESAGYFGLPKEDVFVFSQSTLPACDFEGKLLLETPGRLFENPDGHGGSLTALARSGALDDMGARGIEKVFYYQVDNPLVVMADPVYLGFHQQARAQVSSKVVRKEDPGEKVGVLAEIDGRLGVVEYTELVEPQRSQRASDGTLAFWAGNIATHLFEVDFIREVASRADELLPLHPSAKAIPTIDEAGSPLAPDAPNGYKLERFVFDALPAAERTCLLEVRAREEFAPIKNAEGKDSPATCREALVAEYRRWLAEGGAELPAPGVLLELDHSEIDGVEDVRALRVGRVSDHGPVIRVGTGADA